jgi:hypothetical protein
MTYLSVWNLYITGIIVSGKNQKWSGLNKFTRLSRAFLIDAMGQFDMADLLLQSAAFCDPRFKNRTWLTADQLELGDNSIREQLEEVKSQGVVNVDNAEPEEPAAEVEPHKPKSMFHKPGRSLV